MFMQPQHSLFSQRARINGLQKSVEKAFALRQRFRAEYVDDQAELEGYLRVRELCDRDANEQVRTAVLWMCLVHMPGFQGASTLPPIACNPFADVGFGTSP